MALAGAKLGEGIGTQLSDGDGIVIDEDELVTEGNCMNGGGCVSEKFGEVPCEDWMPPGIDKWDDPGKETTLWDPTDPWSIVVVVEVCV
jgi:hypothetical protein